MPSIQAKLLAKFFKIVVVFPQKEIRLENIKKRKNRNNFWKIFLAPSSATTKQTRIEGVDVDIIRPQEKTDTIIIYIHGGGYVYESTPGHYDLINRLATQTHATVFSVNYKLAPEFQFPTQIHEVKKVYKYLLKQGYDSKRIFFAGDSAGGNIAIATALLLRDQKYPLPAGIIAICAPTDATFTYPSFKTHVLSDIILSPQKMHFFLDCYRGKEPTTNPLISPVFANLKGLPKIQLFVSDNELLFDDAKNFTKKLTRDKVPYELHVGKDLAHGYPLAARFVPESRESITLMTKFVLDHSTE